MCDLKSHPWMACVQSRVSEWGERRTSGRQKQVERSVALTAEYHHIRTSLCPVTTRKQLEIVNTANAEPQACHSNRNPLGKLRQSAVLSMWAFSAWMVCPRLNFPSEVGIFTVVNTGHLCRRWFTLSCSQGHNVFTVGCCTVFLTCHRLRRASPSSILEDIWHKHAWVCNVTQLLEPASQGDP